MRLKWNPTTSLATAWVLWLACLAHPSLANLSDTPAKWGWVTDSGGVFAIARTTDTIYIGGIFNHIAYYTGNGVPIDVGTGQIAATFPQVNGVIYACVADGAGGWYLGGDFTQVGDTRRKWLAHILADGSVDPAWNPTLQGPVENSTRNIHCLALSPDGRTLYVGGDFINVGGQNRSTQIAALDTATGNATAWKYHIGGGVYISIEAIAFSKDGKTLYIAGYFTNIGTQPRYGLAAFDTATGDLTDWNPNATIPGIDDTPGIITRLAISGDGTAVYVAGYFTRIGGQARRSLAALDAATGTATAWNPNPRKGLYDGTVNALALSTDGNTVYVGGDFDAIGGQTRSHIAALDAATGNATAWKPNADNPVDALTIAGGTVYAGGHFTNIGGQERIGLAALDAATGNATAWNLGLFVTNDAASVPTVHTLAVAGDGSRIYAGGGFNCINGQARKNLAAFDARTGNPTAWNPGADHVGSGLYTLIHKLAVSDDGQTVYVGGRFNRLGGQVRNCLGAVDAAGNVTPWDPAPARNDSEQLFVCALALSGDNRTVYAGGSFTSIGGQTRNAIAALETSSGLATAWNPEAKNELHRASIVALLLSGNGKTIYAGGDFSSIGGQERWGIAALDTATSQALAWHTNADARPRVGALALSKDERTLYVGGSFSKIGGQTRKSIAALDTTTGTATAWNPEAGTSNPGVHALAISDETKTVYAGGFFTQMGGQTRSNLVTLDMATGQVNAWQPDPSSAVNALAFSTDGKSLYVGGGFNQIAGEARTGFALFETGYTIAFQTDGTAGATLDGATTQTLTPGASATPVTARAPAGWHFVRWTRDGALYSQANPLTVIQVSGDMTLTAVFAEGNAARDWTLYK